MIYLLDETCLFKTEQLSKVCLKRLFCGPIAQFVSLQCMLTLNGAVSNCRSLGAGDANVGYLSSHPHSRLPHLHA